MTDPNPNNATVGATHFDQVAANLPKFSSYDPEGWFLSLEAQFTTRNVTQSLTISNHILSVTEPLQFRSYRDYRRTLRYGNQ